MEKLHITKPQKQSQQKSTNVTQRGSAEPPEPQNQNQTRTGKMAGHLEVTPPLTTGQLEAPAAAMGRVKMIIIIIINQLPAFLWALQAL